MHAISPSTPQTRGPRRLGALAFVLSGLFSTGCYQRVQRDVHSATESTPIETSVVVYSALDQEFAEPILKDQARKAQVSFRAKFDVESTKTVGLTNTLIAEAVQPRCDLFWNNEILNTMRLKETQASSNPSTQRTPMNCRPGSGTRTEPGTGSRPGPAFFWSTRRWLSRPTVPMGWRTC